MGRRPELTTKRLEILKLLAEHKFLTTSQIQSELDDSPILRRVQTDLAQLKKLAMIQSFAFEPERGRASELCWQLLKAGADELGVIHGSHFTRKPLRERIEFRTFELDLVRQATQHGWQIVKPLIKNPQRPLPTKTEQANILTQALEYAERQAIQTQQAVDPNNALLAYRIIKYNAKIYANKVPLQANDFVVYKTRAENPENVEARVLILCPPRATYKFWQTRVHHYKNISDVVPIFCLFKDAHTVGLHEHFLKDSDIKIQVMADLPNILA